MAISPRLTLVFFVTVPLSLFLTRFQMRRIHPLFRLRSRELGGLNGFAEERSSPPRWAPPLPPDSPREYGR